MTDKRGIGFATYYLLRTGVNCVFIGARCTRLEVFQFNTLLHVCDQGYLNEKYLNRMRCEHLNQHSCMLTGFTFRYI